ncbi:hypothetical protein CANCADRAFT_46330 [Tortispora caseinolytica NRRL Y-17796]|uniref:Uncharacterized protein n=1 Tax=Tortispora caseinolytica NRRL Y-17796 TaxID=767744 RepID=A0A1E4T9I9_9ASCO|nr:hypothetical protein CANCADRAFT_46330 [Tortispora caseinolytica NRRL Y-17796]
MSSRLMTMKFMQKAEAKEKKSEISVSEVVPEIVLGTETESTNGSERWGSSPAPPTAKNISHITYVGYSDPIFGSQSVGRRSYGATKKRKLDDSNVETETLIDDKKPHHRSSTPTPKHSKIFSLLASRDSPDPSSDNFKSIMDKVDREFVSNAQHMKQLSGGTSTLQRSSQSQTKGGISKPHRAPKKRKQLLQYEKSQRQKAKKEKRFEKRANLVSHE